MCLKECCSRLCHLFTHPVHIWTRQKSLSIHFRPVLRQCWCAFATFTLRLCRYAFAPLNRLDKSLKQASCVSVLRQHHRGFEYGHEEKVCILRPHDPVQRVIYVSPGHASPTFSDTTLGRARIFRIFKNLPIIARLKMLHVHRKLLSIPPPKIARHFC